MKIVFVVGFYNPVKKAIESLYGKHLDKSSIIWVGQKAAGREANLSEFSGLYLKQIKAGATSVLILLAQIQGRDFVVGAVESIIAASVRKPETCQLIPFEPKHAGDREIVLKHIADFGLEEPNSLSAENIREKFPKGKFLCVSPEGSTSVLEALRRVGFPVNVVEALFEEERIPGGRNSGLMQHLTESSKRYNALLYSFTGLRTLTPEVKGKFDHCYEAPTAAQLAELTRRWLERD